jgi:HAD superfamily hydrolase (TIGR01509 family)
MAAPVQAVIFDMDGLLIDSEPLWHEAEKASFATVGLHLAQQDCLRTTGLRIDEVVRYWNAPPELAHQIVERVIALVEQKGAPKPGVAVALDACVGRPLGLASSSPSILIDAVLHRLGIRDRFAVAHSAEHEARGKPHPDVYLTTARLLGVSPSACVAVEDSPTGVRAAKAAGMRCVAVPDALLADNAGFAEADDIIESLFALPRVLRW